jgi:L-arabinose isomerase
MGDFYVPPGVLKKTTGIEQVAGDPARIAALLPAADAPEVRTEVESDLKAFEVESVDSAAHVRTTRVCLATRRWIAQEGLSAFTMNFARIGRRSGLPTLPFLEASKAMARGIGYAGEGDVLTAATVGALASAYPETTFAEMFCPDWKGNRVFLSHMGEMNPALAAGRPRLVEQKYAFIDSDSTVLAVGRFRGGDAVMADVAPMGNERYRLIVAPVRMVDVEGDDKLRDSVRGWFSHGRGTAGFLEAYSRAGGTHHLALVYGAAADEIAAFGEFLGWEVVRIEAEP